MNFKEMNLKTIEALEEMGYTSPTEVQIKTIPKIIEGKNLIVRSQTGTGKTAAFGIGFIERLIAGDTKKVLVLTPTRELAMQVCKELNNISARHDYRIFAVYGGQSISVQIDDLKGGYDILVATPGRLLDLDRRRVIRISEFDSVVLDEADHMLDLGFQDEMNDILRKLPKEKHMVLLSATVDESIMSIASKHIPDPEIIEIGHMEVVSTIKEDHVTTTERGKLSALYKVLDKNKKVKTLIFMETKRSVDWMAEKLERRGYPAGTLHGDMSQASRNKIIAQFQEGEISLLVATNVAARGLHIENLGLIINYDKADTDETHLHRVGRTGRMGMTGRVVNFVIRKESKDERMREDHPDFAWMRPDYKPRPERRSDSRRSRPDGRRSDRKPKDHHKHSKGKRSR